MGELYVVLIDHCVCHCRFDLAVTEELLYLLNGHSLIDCACRECAAELVRVHLCDAEPSTELSEAHLNATDRETVVRLLERDEERGIVVCAAVQIGTQMNFRPRIEIDGALLAPLAEHDAFAPLKVDITAVQTYKLANAHSRGGEQINHSEISDVLCMVAQLLQCLVAVCFLDDLRRLDLVNAAHGAL